METVQLIAATGVSVIISSGVVTVIMKWLVENALKEAQAKRKHDREQSEKRYKLDDEWQHNVGRVVFWLHHGVKSYEQAEAKGYWNGELQEAVAEMSATEAKKKELDREQLAEVNENN
jgi:hypothetical protein